MSALLFRFRFSTRLFSRFIFSLTRLSLFLLLLLVGFKLGEQFEVNAQHGQLSVVAGEFRHFSTPDGLELTHSFFKNDFVLLVVLVESHFVQF